MITVLENVEDNFNIIPYLEDSKRVQYWGARHFKSFGILLKGFFIIFL